MKLLVDTDIFCKLQSVGLFIQAVDRLVTSLNDCGRLPALPHMLRRGRLRKKLGANICDALIPAAEALPEMPQPNGEWLDKLVAIEGIDIGEAQLFAAAAEGNLFVVSGDKRALRALKNIDGVPSVLNGRIVVFEALLLSLCDQLGSEVVRRRVAPIASLDNVVKICFSSGNSNPDDGLVSYFEDLQAELAPLVLWDPRSGEAA